MKIIKKSLLIITIITIFTTLNYNVLAMNTNFYEPDNLTTTQNYLTVAGSILKIVSTIGIATSVITIAIVGLRFMFGSIEEKAKYKETLSSYIMGCSMIMFASIIVRVIAELFSK